MSNPDIRMSVIREVLRLKYESALSQRHFHRNTQGLRYF